MSAVISALTNAETGLTSATFYSEIANLVPFIVLMVPISLGLYFLRRLVRGAGRAKVKF